MERGERGADADRTSAFLKGTAAEGPLEGRWRDGATVFNLGVSAGAGIFPKVL